MSRKSSKIKIRIIGLAAVIAILFAGSLLAVISGHVRAGSAGEGVSIATVYQDGRVVAVIELDTAEDTSFVINSPDGGSNTVTVKNHDICVSEGSCPDKLCVKQGFASKSPLPIVCLPNRLVITLEDKKDGGGEAVYDAVTY